MERYVPGVSNSWPGYCDYDREQQQYRWSHIDSLTEWRHLSVYDLAALLQSKRWALDVTPEMSLPEGF